MGNFTPKSKEFVPALLATTAILLGATACGASQEPGTQGKIVEISYPVGEQPGANLVGYQFESPSLVGTDTTVMACDMTDYDAPNNDSLGKSQKKVTVQSGDTIWTILGDPANEDNANYPKLLSPYIDDVTPDKDVIAKFVAAYNNVDPAHLQPGTELVLPWACDIPTHGRLQVTKE